MRLKDNAALYHALKAGRPVMPVFIFDREILDDLPRRDARLLFIHRQLSRLKDQLEAMGSSLWVYEGRPLEVWRQLIQQEEVEAVFANHDYEPYARSRDAAVEALLKESGIAFHTFKDQVMFEKREILTQQGKPYTVFTPYSRQWKA
ncbi:MAG: deoxyribodipyrimidine photo-lyase, partial [Bacteroidetes bacterium]